MARHVADIVRPPVLAGRHGAIRAACGHADRRCRRRSACASRCIADPPGGTTDPGIAGAVRDGRRLLADAGHDVVKAIPPGYERTADLWRMLMIDDIRAQRSCCRWCSGADAMSFLDIFDASSEPTTFPTRPDPRRAERADAPVVGVPPGVPDPAVADVGASVRSPMALISPTPRSP